MTPEPTLPQSVDAERQLIGMAASGEYGDVLADADFVRPADFYIEGHRVVWQAAQAVRTDGVPVNFLSVYDKLKEWDAIGEGKPVDSISDLTAYVNTIPPNATVRQLAESIHKTALRRHDIQRAHLLATAAYSGTDAAWQHERDEAREHLSGEPVTKVPGTGGYHLLSIKEVLNQPRPDPLIDGYYSLDSTGLTYAPPGVGKTVLLLDQMAHVALGHAWEGNSVKGGHVVYVCAAGQAFLPERLQALLLRLGVDDIPRLHILVARPQLLQPQTVAHLLRTFDAELPEPLVWIAFDTVSQTANGARENDADAMGPYLAAMERIREKTRAFVHAIHHTGKDESRGARGSSVFLGNCDTVTYITKDGDTCLWKCEKQRGRWLPFKPFAFKVQSLALDEHADRTGPYIVACAAPTGATEKPRTPTGQVLKVYEVYLRLARHYQDRVFYSTWEKACADASIPESTFKDARRRLADEFHLVYKPEGSDQWYQVREPGDEGEDEDESEGTKGQNEDNDLELSPESQSQDEGQKGQLPLEGLALLSLIDESEAARPNGHTPLGPVCAKCKQPKRAHPGGAYELTCDCGSTPEPAPAA